MNEFMSSVSLWFLHLLVSLWFLMIPISFLRMCAGKYYNHFGVSISDCLIIQVLMKHVVSLLCTYAWTCVNTHVCPGNWHLYSSHWVYTNTLTLRHTCS